MYTFLLPCLIYDQGRRKLSGCIDQVYLLSEAVYRVIFFCSKLYNYSYNNYRIMLMAINMLQREAYLAWAPSAMLYVIASLFTLCSVQFLADSLGILGYNLEGSSLLNILDEYGFSHLEQEANYTLGSIGELCSNYCNRKCSGPLVCTYVVQLVVTIN